MSTQPFDLSRARMCVVMNAGSGRDDKDEQARRITDALRPHVARFEIRKTVQGSDLPRLAREVTDEGFDLIAAFGGDGTQSAIAGSLAGTDRIMAVLPGGTFNYFARDLGVGETLDEALDTIRNARVEEVDVACIDDLVFLNNISLGAYPHILKTREGIYRRWGRSRLAAYWSVLVALRRLRHPTRVTTIVDGQRRDFTTALLFVARSAYQLDSFGLDGADAIRAGKMSVLIAKARRPLPLLGSALRLAFGYSAKDGDFDLIETDSLTIACGNKARLVAHDGEKTRMTPPFEIRMMPDALKILLPADGVSKTKDAPR